jgi:hypothetical protein
VSKSLPGPTRKRSQVLDRARLTAIVIGTLAGGAAGLKTFLRDGQAASPGDIRMQLATSTVGVLLIATLAAHAALVSKFASHAPTVSELLTLPEADREEWATQSTDAQAWREFLGEVVPMCALGASYGLAASALATHLAASGWAVAIIGGGLIAPPLLAVWFLHSRRKELISLLSDSASERPGLEPSRPNEAEETRKRP